MISKEDPTEMLTPAQRNVYRLVCEGHSSRDIAALLDLSLRTVENHRNHICHRLGLSGPHALLQHALRMRNEP